MSKLNKNSAIAVYDSGMGGLTIMKEISLLLPYEDVIYYSDSANCPYGSKSREEIISLADSVVANLVNMGVKIIVIACNTATVNAISFLRSKYKDVIFVGTEPAVRPAMEMTTSGLIGILATKSTVESGHIGVLEDRFSSDCELVCVAGDGLVEMVENDKESSPECISLLQKYLQPLLLRGIDCLVLGCTHYPFLTDEIRSIVGAEVHVINPASSIARRVLSLLESQDLLNEREINGVISYYSSCEEEEYIEKLKYKFNKWLNK